MTSEQLDAHVRATVAWHFDHRTGSPYWLSKSLDFDPLVAIQGYADLARFPAVADDWRDIPARDLIPRGCEGPFAVWESGGTTGAPRRIVDSRERLSGIERINAILEQHGFPTTGDWLHVGPSGPHLVGTNVGRLARMRGALCHYVDVDPRWVKTLYRTGRTDEARRYTDHVVEQVLPLLRSQPISVIAATPPLLQALCERPETYARLAEQARGCIWFGTSMSAESLHLLETEFLPETRFVGWYGNTLMGIACQRPRRPGDRHRCVFMPPAPGAVVKLVDPADPSREVGYGEAGQVRLSVLNRELFLPWHLERDRAVRVEPEAPGGWDGLAEVAPLGGGGARVEGVY